MEHQTHGENLQDALNGKNDIKHHTCLFKYLIPLGLAISVGVVESGEGDRIAENAEEDQVLEPPPFHEPNSRFSQFPVAVEKEQTFLCVNFVLSILDFENVVVYAFLLNRCLSLFLRG